MGFVLEEVQEVPLPLQPAAVVATPDGHFVYVTVVDETGGPHGFIYQFSKNEDGSLSALAPERIAFSGGFPEQIAVSPDSKNIYVSGSGSGESGIVATIVYSIGAGGLLTVLQTVSREPPGATEEVQFLHPVVAPDGISVYLLDTNHNFVWNFPREANGSINVAAGTSNTTSTVNGAACSSDGLSVYVTNNNVVSVFDRDKAEQGKLTHKEDVELEGTLQGLMVTPDGQSVYVCSAPGPLREFARLGGGKLEHTGDTAGDVFQLGVDGDDETIYVADHNEGEENSEEQIETVAALEQYSRSGTAALTPLEPLLAEFGAKAVGAQCSDIAVLGAFAYALRSAPSGNAVFAFRRFEPGPEGPTNTLVMLL